MLSRARADFDAGLLVMRNFERVVSSRGGSKSNAILAVDSWPYQRLICNDRGDRARLRGNGRGSSPEARRGVASSYQTVAMDST